MPSLCEMGDKRSRWQDAGIRRQLPFPRERQAEPRFDGGYVSDDGSLRLRFDGDGSATYGGVLAEWRIEHGSLALTTAEWHCEGALDLAAAYLICTAVADSHERREVLLAFNADR